MSRLARCGSDADIAARERTRWFRCNADLWVRPDAARFLAPGADLHAAYPALATKYSPNQPRVPAGNPDGGQWTDGSGSGRPRVIIDTTDWDGEATGEGSTHSGSNGPDSNPGFDSFGSENQDNASSQDESRPVEEDRYDSRLAGNDDRPQLGPRSRIAIIAELGRRLVQRFRADNLLFDLFNQNGGAVAHVKIDDRDIFGSNSTSPMYKARDRAAADDMRDRLIAKHPDILRSDNIGRAPNNALYHAETNILLRSAAESKGTLAGRSLEIYVDRDFCKNCESIVPLVGLELGNPNLTVIDPRRIFVIKDGTIITRTKR